MAAAEEIAAEAAAATPERALTHQVDIEADLLWNGADMTITTEVDTTTIAASLETTLTNANEISVTGTITTATTEVRPPEAAEDTAAGLGIGTTGGTTILGGGTGDPLADVVVAAEGITTTVDVAVAASVGEERTEAWTEEARTSSIRTSFPTT